MNWKCASLILCLLVSLFACSAETEQNVPVRPETNHSDSSKIPERTQTGPSSQLPQESGFPKPKWEEYQLDLLEKSPKTILDYYHLLPTNPYFANEISQLASLEERDSGLVKINVGSGYLKGGSKWGPVFTMGLFKNRKQGEDYLMLQRLQFGGDMFRHFFEFFRFSPEEGWVSVDSLFYQARTPEEDRIRKRFEKSHHVGPVIPEQGTTVDFVAWPFAGSNLDFYARTGAKVIFRYRWTGERFVFESL